MREAAARSRSGGFTFLELMVVIAILGLLASLVTANLDGITASSRLDGAARSFGNLVMTMHDVATLRQHDLTLEIDGENQRYRTVEVPSATDVPDQRDREEQTIWGDWTTMPQGILLREVAFSATDVERGATVNVTFAATGELTPSGFVVFFARDGAPDEDGVSVEVSGLTGLVAYHRGRFQAEEIRRAEDF